MPTLTDIHEMIAKGEGAAAREEIAARASASPPRSELARLAELSWRAGVPDVGLRLLHRVMSERKGGAAAATQVERAEYAQCLARIGARSEAERILDTLDEKEAPRVLLYRAGLLVVGWDYSGSIPLLTRYLKTPKLSPYEALVAKVNLAAAKVWEGKVREAQPLLRDLLYTASLRGYQLILGRVLELSAECYVTRDQWEPARTFLAEAERRLARSASMDTLFVDKYRAAIDFLERRGGPERRALGHVRAAAVERRHWETVRDCDRFLALGGEDPDLFHHVYFGTPYASYRDRFAKDFGAKASSVPEHYLWNLAGSGTVAGSFDLFTGKLDGSSETLEPGSLLQRLMTVLAWDFYRPVRIAELHSRLYPGEYFNPNSSPRAVHEGIRRLRQWFAKAKVPFMVEERGSDYRLMSLSPFAVRVTLSATRGKRYSPWLRELEKAYPERAFSIAEAATKLRLARRTVQRALSDAVAEGNLERQGRGTGTRYRFSRKR